MEAKFCPFCQRKNKPDAVRCAHCGVLLIAHKSEGYTTQGVSTAIPEGSKEIKSCAERVGQIPAGSFAPVVMDFEQPIIIENQPQTIIGRDSGILGDDMLDLSRYGDVALGISRRHALIAYADGTYTVEDLGSTNGTWLNRRRLTPGQRFPLHADDQIWLGPLKLLFCPTPPASQEKVTLVLQIGNNLMAPEQIMTPQFLLTTVGPYLQAVTDLEQARTFCLDQPEAPVYIISVREEAGKVLVHLEGATETAHLIDKWVTSWRREHLELVGAADAQTEPEWRQQLRPLANRIVDYLQPILPEDEVSPLLEKMLPSLAVLVTSPLELSLT